MEMTLMNINQAADFLGVAVDTLRNWCKKRRITYYTLAGIRFKQTDLEAYRESHRVEAVDSKKTELEQKAEQILHDNENERKAKGYHK